ncbi:hypothetical protein R1sor_005397 [Riccia sorocarpa]|uniref:Uncharacterized protein n=1 Tax=Riccia sorocarpa TaxID=122646 RepID=A0ABD3HLP4_9MARC
MQGATQKQTPNPVRQPRCDNKEGIIAGRSRITEESCRNVDTMVSTAKVYQRPCLHIGEIQVLRINVGQCNSFDIRHGRPSRGWMKLHDSVVDGREQRHRVGVIDEELAQVLGVHLHKWLRIAISIGKTFSYIFLHGIEGSETKVRADSGRDRNENKPSCPVIRRSLVFVGIELCGDFFTDMTNEEKREYNRSMYMRGLHIPDAAEARARMLKDIIDRMTWKKIPPPYRNYRRSMDYWAHYFDEQLYIDPTTCARPIERGPRAKESTSQ